MKGFQAVQLLQVMRLHASLQYFDDKLHQIGLGKYDSNLIAQISTAACAIGSLGSIA